MAQALGRGHAAEIEGRPVHDGGVHLHLALGVEHRAEAGVELRIVLERADGLLDRVERRAAARQHPSADRRRGEEACTRGPGPVRRRPAGAAVQDQTPGGLLDHGRLRMREAPALRPGLLFLGLREAVTSLTPSICPRGRWGQ